MPSYLICSLIYNNIYLLQILKNKYIGYQMKKFATLAFVGLATYVAASTVGSNLKTNRFSLHGHKGLQRTRFGHLETAGTWNDGMVKTVIAN